MVLYTEVGNFKRNGIKLGGQTQKQDEAVEISQTHKGGEKSKSLIEDRSHKGKQQITERARKCMAEQGLRENFY